jgi:spore germination cell wall hydrolase CwlJ-like protein
MVASRIRVISAPLSARFWFSAFCVALMPTSIGYQDLAALVAEQHGIPTSWHLIASPLGTIDAPTFNFTRPVGSAIPEPLDFTAVNFDPRSLDAYAWKVDEPPAVQHARQIEYPSVNREHKGDRLPASTMMPAAPAAASQPVSAPSTPAAAPITAPPPVAADQHAEDVAAPAAKTAQRAEDAAAPLAVQTDVHGDASVAAAPPAAVAVPDAGAAADTSAAESDDAVTPLDQMSFLGDDTGDRSSAIYFGTGVMGAPEGLQSWAPGAAPILADPASAESGLKLAALEGADYSAEEGGETIVGKDQSSLLQTPTQRLALTGKPRAHAVECLQQAIYFEARGEPYEGQQAVAQVIMNRVFSGFYPHDVCGVVFQNAAHYRACQFTFACEGKDLSKIEEPDMWEQAKQIANDELDGKFWLADVGHATHYHAYWVHPSWVHEMVRLFKFGVHTFYRPRNWGDGDDDPVWGSAARAQLAAQPLRPDPEVFSENPLPPPKNADAPVKPEASASPAPAADKSVATAKL